VVREKLEGGKEACKFVFITPHFFKKWFCAWQKGFANENHQK